MRKIKLVMEYDGMGFRGFQKQTLAGIRTVQDTLEEVLRQITGETIRTTVAGRTDAGVHALAQVVSFRLEKDIPEAGLKKALNALLPEDICVSEVEEVDDSFHARFTATHRVYAYYVLNREQRSALLRHRAFHVRKPLDIGAMREGAAFLIGENDFTTFCTACQETEKRVRRLDSVIIAHADELPSEQHHYVFPPAVQKDVILFEFRGNGFLRSMVRMMMGALLRVGSGKIAPAHIGVMLGRRDPGEVNASVPPWGLFLVKVDYGAGKLQHVEK